VRLIVCLLAHDRTCVRLWFQTAVIALDRGGGPVRVL